MTAAYPEAPFTSSPAETKFDVEVIFRMTPEDLARPAVDLDNFAKPVLDTLFTSQNVSRLTGVLLPEVNDTWVFRLLLEKVEVKTPQEQGVVITVTRTHRVPRISALLRSPSRESGRRSKGPYPFSGHHFGHQSERK